MAQKIITIADMQELAKRRGGKCLSEKYITGKLKLVWECERGHRWEAVPAQIKQGRWCPFCARVRQRAWNETRYQ